MQVLLEAIRDRLISKEGRPHTNPALDAKRVFIVLNDELPASPPYPHVLIVPAGRSPTRHASRLKETEDLVDILVNTKINLPRGAHIVGSASEKRAEPVTGPIELARQIEDLLDDWQPTDADGNDLDYDVSEWMDDDDPIPLEEGRVASVSVRMHFRFVRFRTHVQPT